MNNPGARAVHSFVPRVLLLDNRDSFTWNIAQAFMELGALVEVADAAAASAAAIVAGAWDLVCIGPGPRGPRDLPQLVALAGALSGRVPLLGVCLGMQALVRAHGGAVARAAAAVHGKRDAIAHDGVGVLAGLPSPLWVMRYHSLVAAEVPARFSVTARDAHGQPMAMRDAAARIEAVQFHPESVGTAGGMRMLANALGVPVPPRAERAGGVPPPSSLGPGFMEALYGRSHDEPS